MDSMGGIHQSTKAFFAGLRADVDVIRGLPDNDAKAKRITEMAGKVRNYMANNPKLKSALSELVEKLDSGKPDSYRSRILGSKGFFGGIKRWYTMSRLDKRINKIEGEILQKLSEKKPTLTQQHVLGQGEAALRESKVAAKKLGLEPISIEDDEDEDEAAREELAQFELEESTRSGSSESEEKVEESPTSSEESEEVLLERDYAQLERESTPSESKVAAEQGGARRVVKPKQTADQSKAIDSKENYQAKMKKLEEQRSKLVQMRAQATKLPLEKKRKIFAQVNKLIEEVQNKIRTCQEKIAEIERQQSST